MKYTELYNSDSDRLVIPRDYEVQLNKYSTNFLKGLGTQYELCTGS